MNYNANIEEVKKSDEQIRELKNMINEQSKQMTLCRDKQNRLKVSIFLSFDLYSKNFLLYVGYIYRHSFKVTQLYKKNFRN